MLFDQNIRTPQHDKIVLSRTRATISQNADGTPLVHITSGLLDENDAIRLAAFLNRWYREQNQKEVREEAERVKANREAKKARYEARRPTGDRYAAPAGEGL